MIGTENKEVILKKINIESSNGLMNRLMNGLKAMD